VRQQFQQFANVVRPSQRHPAVAHYAGQQEAGAALSFDPHELPIADSVPADHPKVVELRKLSEWSEGQVWCSPERHGTLTAVFKNQIDWLPLELGGVRPTQGRTLAVMQVCVGSQSFNAVNALRVPGRWMRMVTIPNQSSVAKAYSERKERAPEIAAALAGEVMVHEHDADSDDNEVE
jgi:arsenic resistance protein ArsH